MAWYDAGAGAGVWDNAIINPSLKNILHQLCTAVNEREIYRGSSLTVSSITRSGTTATLTAAANHGLATGAKVYVFGADQAEYNGLVTITVTGATTFTYTVSGSPATPATGTIKYRKPSSSFTYNENGDQKMFPAVADFVGLPLSRIGTGPARTVAYSFTPTSITRLFTVATINTTAEIIAKVTVGDSIQITGADQAEYNGVWAVISKGATSFTVDIGTTPATPATGTITVRHYARMTRSGSTVTVWLRASGLKVGDRVEIAGAAESDYNGWQTVTAIPSIVVTSITRSGGTATVNTSAAHGLGVGDVVAIEGCAQAEYNKFATIASVPTATSFTYSVSGSPATPATGTPNCNDLTRFQFTTSATPSSPATGSITATAHRHLIAYAEYSGGTTTFQCYEHGLTTGDYVEAVWTNGSEYGAVTVTDSNVFTMSTSSWSSPYIAGISDFMWVVPEGKFRKLLRQLQTTIAGLITSSTNARVIRFVEDSAPYETNYTLANLLGAGSYGSSWVSLKGLSRGDLANVLMQMQDALDLLTTTTVNDEATISNHDNYRSWNYNSLTEHTRTITITSALESGGTITVDTSAAHNLSTGHEVLIRVYNVGDATTNGNQYFGAVTVTDSDTFTMPSTCSASWGLSVNEVILEVSREIAWDNVTGGSPYNTNTVSTYVSRRFCRRLDSEISTSCGADTVPGHLVEVEYDADAVFAISVMAGTFVAGSMYLQESNVGDVTQDSYTLTDGDGDTASIDTTLGTTDELITVTKTSAFFGAASKTLNFATPTPASNPFSSSLTDTEESERYVKVRTTNACKHTRELVPGTHLTYG